MKGMKKVYFKGDVYFKDEENDCLINVHNPWIKLYVPYITKPVSSE